jgi:thymidylate synthase
VFAHTYGELGPTYGHHMRNFGQVFFKDLPEDLQSQLYIACDGFDPHDEILPGIDQVQKVIDTIKKDPDNRRIIMTLWNPSDNEKTLLPPCPCFYHFRVLGGKLHLQVYQRSSDTFLGVPFNTAQEALLLIMVAHVCQLPAGI